MKRKRRHRKIRRRDRNNGSLQRTDGTDGKQWDGHIHAECVCPFFYFEKNRRLSEVRKRRKRNRGVRQTHFSQKKPEKQRKCTVQKKMYGDTAQQMYGNPGIWPLFSGERFDMISASEQIWSAENAGRCVGKRERKVME